MSNWCIACGCEIPEGMMVCIPCSRRADMLNDNNAYECSDIIDAVQYAKDHGWIEYVIRRDRSRGVWRVKPV